MPRASTKSQTLTDQPFPELDSLPADPAPVAAPTRRRGRPPGSKNKTTSSAPTKRITTRNAAGRIQSKAQMQEAAAAQIGTILELAIGGWELRDPTCAGAFLATNAKGQRHLDVIVERAVAMMSRSDAVLRMFSQSTIVMEGALFAAALKEPIQTVWHHHGPSGVGHGEEDGYDLSGFPAFQPAAA